jgi:hypothetical protein
VQFNDLSNITQTDFISVTAPVKKRGLIVVSVVLGSHLVLILGIILPLFLKQTTVSTLGNAWQAVAQVYGDKTKEMLDKAPLAVDSVVEEVVKRPEGKKGKLKNHEIVGIGLAEGGSGTDIITAKGGYIRVAGGEEGMRRTAHGRDAGSSDDVSADVSGRDRNSREGRLAGDIPPLYTLPGEQNAQTGHENGVAGIGRAQ